MSDNHTEVTDSTRQAEAEDARADHVADRPATPAGEAAVDGEKVDEDLRRHHQEMTQLGAQDPGEGRIR